MKGTLRESQVGRQEDKMVSNEHIVDIYTVRCK